MIYCRCPSHPQVGQLHGDMTPLERAAVLDAARKGAFQLLLVSDVAARGIDMPQVGLGLCVLSGSGVVFCRP